MIIKCLFITRDTQSSPELIEAWDEETYHENPDGFNDACDQKLKELHKSNDLEGFVYVNIDIGNDHEADIRRACLGFTLKCHKVEVYEEDDKTSC